MHQVAWRCAGMILQGHAVHGRPTAAVQEDMQIAPRCLKFSRSNTADLNYKRAAIACAICMQQLKLHAGTLLHDRFCTCQVAWPSYPWMLLHGTLDWQHPSLHAPCATAAAHDTLSDLLLACLVARAGIRLSDQIMLHNALCFLKRDQLTPTTGVPLAVAEVSSSSKDTPSRGAAPAHLPLWKSKTLC
jgi:hypothetical protein